MVPEHVALPDARDHPLVHPIDLPPAAAAYMSSRRWSLMTRGPVLFFVGALAWSLTGEWLAPGASMASVAVIGSVAGAALERDAWSYIPLPCQDHDRALPARWGHRSSLIDVLSLNSGCLLLLAWMQRAGVDTGVTSFALGSTLAVALMVMLDVWTSRPNRALRARPLTSWITFAAATVAALLAAVLAAGDDASEPLVASGAALVTLVHAGGVAIRNRSRSRRLPSWGHPGLWVRPSR